MDHLREKRDRGVVNLVRLDQGLEGALAVLVGVLSACCVETGGALALRVLEHMVSGDVDDFGIAIDELENEPGTGDPVCLGVFSCHPLHDGPSRVG